MIKWFILGLGIIIIFFVIINLIPPKKKVSENPFVIKNGRKPIVAAHRGGKNNPENTLRAIKYSVEENGIDALEIDLCITKDNYLILNHNYTVNETTDAECFFGLNKEYFVNDLNLKELQQLNFGYNYKNEVDMPFHKLLDNISLKNREKVLRDNNLCVVTIDEVFELFKDKNLLYIIELKNANELGLKAADILIEKIKKYKLEKKVIIGQFHDEVYDYISNKYPNIYHGGSQKRIKNFALTTYFGINIFNNNNFSGFQVPTFGKIGKYKIRLDRKILINRCHKLNISVQYWTINKKSDMERLIKLGADVIMTDDPELLKQVIKEINIKKVTK